MFQASNLGDFKKCSKIAKCIVGISIGGFSGKGNFALEVERNGKILAFFIRKKVINSANSSSSPYRMGNSGKISSTWLKKSSVSKILGVPFPHNGAVDKAAGWNYMSANTLLWFFNRQHWNQLKLENERNGKNSTRQHFAFFLQNFSFSVQSWFGNGLTSPVSFWFYRSSSHFIFIPPFLLSPPHVLAIGVVLQYVVVVVEIRITQILGK